MKQSLLIKAVKLLDAKVNNYIKDGTQLTDEEFELIEALSFWYLSNSHHVDKIKKSKYNT